VGGSAVKASGWHHSRLKEPAICRQLPNVFLDRRFFIFCNTLSHVRPLFVQTVGYVFDQLYRVFGAHGTNSSTNRVDLVIVGQCGFGLGQC
jgi:hypothetical protein